MQIPVVHTERFTLRSPEARDFDAYAEFRGSDRAKMLGGPFTRIEAWDQLSELIGHWTLRGYGRWMVADRTTDEPLGVVGPYCPEGWPEPEIAWSVFGNAEGKGVAFEAAEASRKYAYETLGWTTAISLIDPKNTRSLALAKRLGCREDGVYQHEVYGPMHIWRHPGPAEVAA